MVDPSDIGKIQDIYRNMRQVQSALDIMEQGGRITAITVASTAHGESGTQPQTGQQIAAPRNPVVSVQTTDVDYPSEVIGFVNDVLKQRLNNLRVELTRLGVKNA